MTASKQTTYIHTHADVVSLVWGLLRLAPITSETIHHRGASLSEQQTAAWFTMS